MSAPTDSDLWPDIQPDAARRLLRAGLDSFAERGYHATTTRDVATAAGMSPAALYVYFPSKAALLFEISRDGHQKTLGLVEQSLAHAGSTTDKMRYFVRIFVAWHARRHTIARVVQYELRSLPAKEYQVVRGLRRNIEAGVRALLGSGVEHGEFDVPDLHTAATVVLSLGVDVARWYSEKHPKTPEQLGDEYAELVLRMLRAG
ncbi:TetR family transcriptional regulator [Tamaricihabitans halophyticus]|uniref:TetR family transcriptional regulator n=1 Tax=Tamaricihabitans halophyticus TaxID=1262583 RepID=A0A4R2QSR5_9PSEU|nr:TetR/AcrR family transcriptional regulator [Tamaricihabitans halophyticus]TCP50101.1 TetR family transcriptional regulator [Tamaricihabitans halophyticus]